MARRRWIAAALASLAVGLGASAVAAEALDRSSPRRTLESFSRAVREGRLEEAASLLDLRTVPPEQRERGAQIAQQLQFVFDQKLWLEGSTISDDPQGDPADGADRELVGSIAVGDRKVPVLLVRDRGGWRIAAETVEAVPLLWKAYGVSSWIGKLPDWMLRWRFLELAAWQWFGLALSILLAGLVGWLLGTCLAWFGRRFALRTPVQWDEQLVDLSRRPLRFLIGVISLGFFVDGLQLAAPAAAFVQQQLRILLIVAGAWLCTRAVGVFTGAIEAALVEGNGNETRRRSVATRMVVMRRVVLALLWTLAGALVLVQFEVVRTVGVSLLASAGIAGIALGLAAQKSLTALLSGIQLSLTQPVRIGDTVIVEGEWGTIEEIHLTYVVVKIWDLRRLVLPINHFLEQPFQNWTRNSTEILGTVELFVDFKLPVDLAREQLQRICEASPDWDGKLVNLRVTNMTDRTMTLRCLMSAADASRCFALRCEVREKMIAWLRDLEGGRYLPRTRFERDEEPRDEAEVAGALAS